MGDQKQSLNLDRVLMDFTGKDHFDDCLTVRDVFENLFIFGSTGSGKSSTVGHYLIRKILNSEKLAQIEKMGMVVFLYKSSDIDLWQKWCSEQDRMEDLLIINHEDKNVLNLLDHYRDKEPIEAVDALMNLSGLTMGGVGNQGSDNAYWTQANRQRLHRLILLNQLSKEKLNIKTLYKIHRSAPINPKQLQDKTFFEQSLCLQLLWEIEYRLGEKNEQVQLLKDYFILEMPYLADRTQSSILSITSSILEPFISSNLLSNLFCGETGLDLNEMVSGKIVILNLPIQQYGMSAKIAQVMFKYIIQKHIQARDLKAYPNPVILFLDEYQHYITQSDFLFLSTARSCRAGSIMLTQNVSNLYAQMGGEGKAAIENVNALLGLANTKFFLASNSFATNEFCAKLIGRKIERMGSTHIPIDGATLGSASLNEQYQFQVQPNELTMLKRGGQKNQGIVECFMTATGKRFSNGCNYLKLAFEQPWFRGK